MNIRPYLTQTAIWKKPTGARDAQGKAATIDTPINVRWEARNQVLIGEKVNELISRSTVFLVEDVKPGEVLVFGGRSWVIHSIQNLIGLDGTNYGKEVTVNELSRG